jgi:tetratricopeptide (TPR) repeat protein
VAALQSLIALELVSAAEAEPYLQLARSLAEEAFPVRQAACLRESPVLPGTQTARLRHLDDLVSLYLTARLHPSEATLHPVRERFDALSAALSPADQEITFFCAEAVTELSQRETARGVRAFAQDDLVIARQHFEHAVAYNADNPLPVWNLARLALAEGRRLDALAHYAALLEVLPAAADALREEMDAATERTPGRWQRFAAPVAAEVRA